MAPTAHQVRINTELKQAGVHHLELHRHMFKLLPDVMRSNEHIEAIAYGLNAKKWHAMLVATDHRVIYIEADLMFSDVSEAPYEIVHGTEQTHAPMRVGLKLKTLGHVYSLEYVKKDCANRFVAYIEDRVEKMGDLPSGFTPPHEPTKHTNKKTHSFVDDSGLPNLPLAHIYDVQRDFLEQQHTIVITHKGRENTLISESLQYHMHNDALFAVAEKDLAQTFDLKKLLTASVHDHSSGRTLQLEVILKVEMNPVVLSMGLSAEGNVQGSDIYRLQIIDLAFIASAK